MWTTENAIFTCFANFWATKSKVFSGKVRQSIQNYLNQNLVVRTFLENGSGATLSSKTNVVSIWKGNFTVFFASFWVTKLKPFYGKVKQGIQSQLNQNLVIGIFLANGSEATLTSNMNLSVWKGHFPLFANFWEIKLKRPKLFKSKLGHSKLLKKWFWNYLELKNEYCQRLKWAFFIFVQVFEWRSWNHFLVIGSVLENGFEAPFSSKTNVLRVWKEHFLSFLQVLNDKVATLFWKGEAKRSKLFKL